MCTIIEWSRLVNTEYIYSNNSIQSVFWHEADDYSSLVLVSWHISIAIVDLCKGPSSGLCLVWLLFSASTIYSPFRSLLRSFYIQIMMHLESFFDASSWVFVRCTLCKCRLCSHRTAFDLYISSHINQLIIFKKSVIENTPLQMSILIMWSAVSLAWQ